MLTKKLATFFLFLIITILLAIGDFYFEKEYITKIFYTASVISSVYLLFKILLETILSKKVKNYRSRYSFRKTLHILFLVISFAFILRIWVVNPQVLVVAYGLIAAGVAISLQDFFKNITGGIIIFFLNSYQVGDRIELNGKCGDVIDIGILYTTLLEIREWVDGDQTTGRLCIIPNGVILYSNISNYTKDHDFIWDEFMLPITYDSNWQKAVEIIKRVITEETVKYIDEAENSLSKLEDKYYLSEKDVDVDVYVKITDNWIQMNARYIVEVRSRRSIQSSIMKKILVEFSDNSDIDIASATFSLVDFKKD